uniref:Uncharacterized protein n=1 Tax=Amorphochlora amoebiformis TaxID=1561963 RepID=A0A7S0DKI1_9EUKA
MRTRLRCVRSCLCVFYVCVVCVCAGWSDVMVISRHTFVSIWYLQMLASTGERAVTLWEPMDEGFQNWQDIRDRLPSIVATNKNRNATKIRRMVTQSQLRGIMSQQDNNCSIQ